MYLYLKVFAFYLTLWLILCALHPCYLPLNLFCNTDLKDDTILRNEHLRNIIAPSTTTQPMETEPAALAAEPALECDAAAMDDTPLIVTDEVPVVLAIISALGAYIPDTVATEVLVETSDSLAASTELGVSNPSYTIPSPPLPSITYSNPHIPVL